MNNSVTFNGAIGDMTPIAALNITPGRVAFENTVSATTITSAGRAIFNGAVTIGTGNATFARDVQGTGAIDIGTNIVIFDGMVDQIVDIVIDGAGTVRVNNTGDGVVFRRAVGSSMTPIATLDLSAGITTFDANVTADTITGGPGLAEFRTADIATTATINTAFTVGSGNANFAGNVAGDGRIGIAGNRVTFNGTGAQTVANAIDGAGTLTVNNMPLTGVSFNSAIGGGGPIAALNLHGRGLDIRGSNQCERDYWHHHRNDDLQWPDNRCRRRCHLRWQCGGHWGHRYQREHSDLQRRHRSNGCQCH